MKSSSLLHLPLMIAAAIPATMFVFSEAQAATVSLTTADAPITTSWNTAGHWSNGQAPSGANDYNTANFVLRTPTDATTPIAFAGASLTLGPSTDPSGNGSMIEKFSLGAGNVRTITINNFTNSPGARIRSGNSGGAIIHIAGNHFTIVGTNAIWADQCVWVIDSPLIGGDSAVLTNYANNGNGAVNHTTYTANNSAFTGSWYLTVNAGTTDWSAELDSVNSVPADPSTFNPGQITFLTGGQLRDTAGCSFTNSNGGFTLAANGNINTTATTLIGEPITDLTNGVHSVSSLTSSGTGTLVLSNANNNYSGGTAITVGTLQLGVDNAVPGNTVAGDVSVSSGAVLDLNGHNLIINGLNGAGSVDTVSGGTPTLTVGANGDNGTFSGTVQNSSGTLTLIKAGAGTETLSGLYTYSGATIVAAGTLSLTTASGAPSSPGNLIVSNGAVLTANAASGTAVPASNFIEGTNATVNLILVGTANGINASGNLTFQDSAINNLNYGTVSANPTSAAFNSTAGTIIAAGANIAVNISATGLKVGTFPLIKYTGPPHDITGNLSLNPPPGVGAYLSNNIVNPSIDIVITNVPNQLAWNGVNGTSWDLTTANWTNLVSSGITVFQQYTNGSVIAGDAVRFDDTLTNDLVNPQPTNVNLTAQFFAFPVVVDSTLPYSIAGAGGIRGVTSLLKTNSGSLSLLTSNSYSGGVTVGGGTLIITNDSALGASSGGINLNAATLQINGPVTNSRPVSIPASSTIGVSSSGAARLTGVISGAGGLSKTDNGTLILAAAESFGGNLFGKGGTLVIDSGGSINNGGNYSSIGQNNSDVATLTVKGTGLFTNNADFNVGDSGNSTGTLNIQDTAVVNVSQTFIGSSFDAGSAATGTVNMTGGSFIERNAAAGNFTLGGRNTGANGVGVINLTNGFISAAGAIRVGDWGAGTINQYGGVLECTNNGTGINLHRENTAGSIGTNNLNGGILRVEKVTSSFAFSNSWFYFNGGTLQAANGNLGATPFMNNLLHAYIRNGGAVIDSQSFSVIVNQALEHSTVAGDNATDGGLTKKGTGTVTMTATNTFTGPITNVAGTLFLNSSSTYPGVAYVNAGTLQVASATTLQGGAVVGNGAILVIAQTGNATNNMGNLTFNGGSGIPGGTFAPNFSANNNPAVPLVTCGTLTLNGTNTVSLAASGIGTTALINYTSLVAGSGGLGNITNLTLSQGAGGYISNSVANSTIYAVVTNLGPGLVWSGTNSTPGLTNLWDINSTTNWLLGGTPTRTTYHQILIPGDGVTFNDVGSGVVILNANAGPTSLLISNSAKTYTFSGSGTISGPTAVQKLGSGLAVVNLTNSSYLGNTIISNGTLQVGSGSAVSPNANAVIGPSGTLELNGFSQTTGDLIGSGVVDNVSGTILTLTVGGSGGGTWNGTIRDQQNATISLTKNGTGTWVVGGTNNLANGSAFTVQNQFNGGTTVITNLGVMNMPFLQMYIANGAAASVVVAGGSLTVSNRIVVGRGGASGTLTVNSGTITHGGPVNNVNGDPNNIYIGGATALAGASAGTGTFIVNGGQVLNTREIKVGGAAGATGTFILNGGLVQALDLFSDAGATSTTIFNGGTLQAVGANANFIQTISQIMSNGLVLDDGGFPITIAIGLEAGDAFNGGVTKQGAGAVYFDAANSYTGTTLVNNGTFGGGGSIAGPLVVAPAGNVAPGDAGALAGGVFTMASNLTLQGTATFRISVTASNPANDQITGITTANYGGTLVVNNVTSDATVLTNGQSFQLFSAGSGSGNFASIVGSPGAGLSYAFHPSTGVLSVVKGSPYFTHISVSGITLNISGTNGTPAGNYVLLGSTNVALPVVLWTRLLTNSFDGSGNFNLSTNIVDPGVPDQFYILSQ